MSTVLKASSCFAIITAPLAFFGANPLNLEVGGIQIYRGKLQDVATSYLAIAGLASLGLSTVGRKGSKKEESVVLQASVPVAEVPPSSFSAQDLRSDGLDFFLDDEPSPAETAGNDIRASDFLPVNEVLANRSLDKGVIEPVQAESPQGPGEQDSIPLASETVFSFQPDLPEPESLQTPILEDWAEAFLLDEPLAKLEDSLAALESPVLPVAAPLKAEQQPLNLSVNQPAADPVNEQPIELLPTTVASAPAQPELSMVDAGEEGLLAAAPAPQATNAQADRPLLDLQDVTTVLPSLAQSSDMGGNAKRLPSVVPTMPAAQAYLGFAHLTQTVNRTYTGARDVNAELEALEQLQAVREQIQSLSAQMEMIQTHLHPQSFGGKRLVVLPSATPQKPTYTVSAMESGEQKNVRTPSRRQVSVAPSIIAS